MNSSLVIDHVQVSGGPQNGLLAEKICGPVQSGTGADQDTVLGYTGRGLGQS
jgi:hypothetical protein